MPTLRIEFVALGLSIPSSLGDASAITRVIDDAEIEISATETPLGSRPVVPPGATHAVISAVGLAAYVAWEGINGNKVSPQSDPGRKPRLMIAAGDNRILSLKPGSRIGCVASNVS